MENKIKDLIEKPLEEIGLSIYKIEYVKEDNEFILRIYLDCDTGVDMDTCVRATNVINPIIDEADPIKDSYILEVSSKGVEIDE